MAFEELKARQSAVWSSAPFENIEWTIEPMHEDLVRRLAPQPGERWLDVGCGPGAVAMRAARAGADVTGVDLAPGLIETAKRRAEQEGLEIDYLVGDAEALPVGDGSFDVVSSSVGAIFAPDHGAVARELARVTRPGGRLGLTSWRPDGGVPEFMRLLGQFGPPPPEGAGDPFEWGREQHAQELLEADFELEFFEGDAPQEGESAEAIWELTRDSVGPAKALYGSLEPERQEELRRAVVDFYDRYRTGNGIHQPRPYLLILGTRR
jgi:SAM-dependent methyltransferase